MVIAALAGLVLTQATPKSAWIGDLTLTIKGEGTTKNDTSFARWKIDREVKGRIVLDRRDQGASIAGSPDSKNQERYESWNGSARLPLQMRIQDEVVLRAPLHGPREIRRDTLRVACPVAPERAPKFQGEIGWPTLQLDLKTGTYVWDAPRLNVPAQRFFRREFVEGPKSWTSIPPIIEDEVRLGYEAISDLNQPREWFRITGPYKPGQTEITLSRKLPFTVKLCLGLTPPILDAELTLVLRKTPRD